MKLCLDEHYSPQIAVELRNLGHDVDCVKERPELQSLNDPDLFTAMTLEHRALLTENVGDFAPLANQVAGAGDSHYGLIHSSLTSMPRSRNTIGLFVERLTVVLNGHPGEDDFMNKVEWL